MTSLNTKGTLKAQKRRSSALLIFGGISFFMLIISPALSASLVRDGLRLCALTVVPSLFPFMALSEIIIGCLPSEKILQSAPRKRFFGLPAHCLLAILLGVLCGAPVGARCASSLYRDGLISADEFARLLPLCNIPSAPFIICAVGELTFGDRALGAILYISCLVSALVCGYLSGKIFRTKNSRGNSAPPTGRRSGAEDFSAISLFCDSVCSASASVISICAFITFFYTFVGILRSLFSPPSLFSPLLFGFFEMTGGVTLAPRSGASGIYLAAAILGWSGLSVHLQVMNVCRNQTVSFKPYFFSKLLSFLLCPLLVFLICSLKSI